MPTDKLSPNDFGDVGEALVVQHAVNVFTALLAELLVSPKLSSLLVFILKFLEPQSHAPDNIKPFLGQLLL